MPNTSETPNIVFLHVDQLHHQALSCMGDPNVNTPYMDEIFADGTAFMSSHCANPVCCPSRGSWYTGRMSSENGLINNGFRLEKDKPDLGQWMSSRGYDCYYAGKWHVTGRTLDESFQLLTHGHPHGERGDPAVAKISEAFLQNYPQQDRPFFLNVGFLNPHDICYLTGNPKKQRHFKQNISGILKEKLPALPPSYSPNGKQPSKIRDYTAEDFQLYAYYYYRMVEMIDVEVGRVYRALKNSAHAENTLFIFSSDHGEMKGAHNRTTKGVLTDDSWRVPLVFCQPGKIKAGHRDETHLTTGIDVTATILDYANMPAMPKMTIARSLKPILEGATPSWRPYVVGETLQAGPQRSVRDSKFKTIFHLKNNTQRLFNMEADPLEMKDLSRNPQYKEVLAQHRSHLKEFESQIEPCAAYIKHVAG